MICQNNNNLISLNNDLKYGLGMEDRVISRLSDYFGETITKALDKYSPFDAYSENTKYEIKSRRCKHNTYPTTIIGIDKTRVVGRKVFIFNFTDGLYYIVYDKERFSTYEVKPVEAIRFGGNYTQKEHFFIPIGDLTRINI